MSDKVIAIEELPGPFQLVLQDVMRMVPDRDRADVNLRRLLAFRLRLDGEAALREYLMKKIREAIVRGHTGSFYDFIHNDLKDGTRPPDASSDLPSSA